MTDDRLRRWLEAAEQPLAPDSAFAADLREDLRAELGFASAPTLGRAPGATPPRTRAGRGPWRLLLVAAVIVAGSLGIAAVGGTVIDWMADRRPSLLDEVRQTGRIRLAVTPGHPQVAALGQPAAGFDIDVARALADHLGVRGDIVLLDAGSLMSGVEDDAWDAALPSVASRRLDGSRFVASSAYYRWPHRLVVVEPSTASGPGDVAEGPICAVAGDEGLAWLGGDEGGVPATPVTNVIVTRDTDDECIAALLAGDVVALVTARLSDADLQVRSGIRVIGGPAPEPRSVIVRRADDRDTDDLLAAIDAALAGMRRDGTLSRLSQNRFGGADLTAP